MNIFVTDECPYASALALDDKRVIKMALESAQVLCSSLLVHEVKDIPYKMAHKNHPASVWARRTRDNFDWLTVHGLSLCNIYRQVYGKVHACESVIKLCMRKRNNIPDGPLEPFQNCSLVRVEGYSVIDSYRDTMNIKWSKDHRRPTWQGRGRPDWYQNLG